MNPSFLTRLRAEWAPSIPRELLAGAVATFALIPEVIAFSFVAGVDPSVGLFASFVISLVIAFTGGRSAMISASTAAVAVLVIPLVREHGVERGGRERLEGKGGRATAGALEVGLHLGEGEALAVDAVAAADGRSAHVHALPTGCGGRTAPSQKIFAGARWKETEIYFCEILSSRQRGDAEGLALR